LPWFLQSVPEIENKKEVIDSTVLRFKKKNKLIHYKRNIKVPSIEFGF